MPKYLIVVFRSIFSFYKITELLRALSLADSCVQMRECKHGCDVCKSNRALFLCLHSLIRNTGNVGRILQSYTNPRLRLGFAQLSRILPTLLVFRRGYVNTGKVLHCLNNTWYPSAYYRGNSSQEILEFSNQLSLSLSLWFSLATKLQSESNSEAFRVIRSSENQTDGVGRSKNIHSAYDCVNLRSGMKKIHCRSGKQKQENKPTTMFHSGPCNWLILPGFCFQL